MRRRKPSKSCSANGTLTRMLTGCKSVQPCFSSYKKPDTFSKADRANSLRHGRCRSDISLRITAQV